MPWLTAAQQISSPVWLTGLFGMIGAIVGAGITGTVTARMQARVQRAAEEERRRTSQEVIIVDLLSVFAGLQHQVRASPEGTRARRARMSTAEREALLMAEKEWGEKSGENLVPAAIAVPSIRDDALRERLNEVLELLDQWRWLGYGFYDTSRTWILGGLAKHAVECLGAWRREVSLPEPNKQLTEVRAVWALKQEQWEQELEYEKEERWRRQQAKEVESNSEQETQEQ